MTMTKGIKSLAMLAAMMMAAEEGRPASLYDEEENVPRVRCGGCAHCPTGSKTFCKVAGHHTTKTTVCTYCMHYKRT